VGNIKDTATAECERRPAYIRLLYKRATQEYGCDYWPGWALPWAKVIARQGNIKISGTEYAKHHGGAAAEELGVAHILMGWGLPVTIVNPDLISSGYGHLKEIIDIEVKRAVDAVLTQQGKAWGTELVAAVKSDVPRSAATTLVWNQSPRCPSRASAFEYLCDWRSRPPPSADFHKTAFSNTARRVAA
jgi:hypothetical protein